MSPQTKKQIGRYAAALGIFVIALIARLLLDLIVPWRLPFITFFPAVFLAAYYLGSGPGVLVLALSTIAGTTWVDPFGQSDQPLCNECSAVPPRCRNDCVCGGSPIGCS